MPQGSFECPVCGEDVPSRAKSCPHCGACDKTGWNEEGRAADGLDLPGEDNFNYEEFVRKEFGSPNRMAATKFVWKATAVVIVVLLAAVIILGFFIALSPHP